MPRCARRDPFDPTPARARKPDQPGHSMVPNEMVHDARVIRIGGQHLPSSVRNWLGDSVGHWEGDVLVVDTTNFTDKTQFEGSGEHLHVVERFSRLSDGSLLYQF